MSRRSCCVTPIAVVEGWIDRAIGWIDNKLEELARYAADPTAGGGLQSVEYLVLQLLNRHIAVLQHLRSSSYVHPERLFQEFLRLVGELATFATAERRAGTYPQYDQDDLENVFGPVMRDPAGFSQRATRPARDPARDHPVAAQRVFIADPRPVAVPQRDPGPRRSPPRRPLVEIQNDFPHLFKVGPNTKMNEIVHANLPGVPLVHLPTPPPHIRAITDHVYFYLDRKSQLSAGVQQGGVDRDALLGRLAGTRIASVGDSGRPPMNDKDKPANPFGRAERTIIRPNPGGRLPQVPDPVPPSADPGRAAPRAPYSPVPPSASPSSGYSPQSPGYAAAPTTPALEEWASTPATPAQPPRFAEPAAPMLRVDELVAPNANPIMRAAGPLLQLLGRLRVALMRASFASLMEQVADAVKFFETDIRSAGISEYQANTAKYILCATADDIVQHIPTDERHVWTQYSMLSRFFGERVGGVRFFEILDHLKTDPLVNYPVLELQHACLALGFQGMHRTSPNGVASLQVIQRNLYELLRRVRPKIGCRPVAALAGPETGQSPPACPRAGLDGGGGGRGIVDGGLSHAADPAVGTGRRCRCHGACPASRRSHRIEGGVSSHRRRRHLHRRLPIASPSYSEFATRLRWKSSPAS